MSGIYIVHLSQCVSHTLSYAPYKLSDTSMGILTPTLSSLHVNISLFHTMAYFLMSLYLILSASFGLLSLGAHTL
jgi:hypothetical protein